MKREPGSAIILPAVVHWKVGHYGALIRELNGKYLLEDPTFGNHTWLSAEALDAEASGYFLIENQPLPEGWSLATDTQGADIYGKGHSGNGGENETAKNDKKCGGDDCDEALAMARYSFHTLLASLSISDTPVGYPAARGEDVRVNVTYNQREAGQPSLMLYSNFSPKWVSNWVSYLEDDTSSPGADVEIYLRGGGSETYTDFDAQSQTYGIDGQTLTRLVKLTADTYKIVYPDGSEHYYEHYMGTLGANRRVFLSRVVDPQDNEVTIEYDSTITSGARIKYIHDATGLSTEFFYNHPWNEFLVTSIEDPYGRSATFTYSSVNGVVRLTDIEDVYGIVSSFGYDDGDGITRLTTPYGTTVFELSDFNLAAGSGYDLIRYIESTDHYGDKERLEYNLDTNQTGVPNTLNETLPDSNIVNFTTGDNDDRNSFYWDKQQMKYGAGDYSKAHLYHWLQPTSADSATGILESEKSPLEGRIWYNYPGQDPAKPYIKGDLAEPSVVARVVEDETGTLVTQAYQYEYNALGNPTKIIDPEGRETLIEYAANGIDIRYVKQRVADSGGQPVYETLSEFTYNSNDPDHRPRKYIDAGGNETVFSYNSHGQILAITNELNEVITFTYETNINNNGYGKLLTVTGDVPGGNRTYSYDSFDRIRTETDSEGHTLTYDYDALDRITLITYPDSSYEQFDYENHSMVASRDREGRWTRYFHNALQQPVLQRDPLGQLTQYEWCRCGDIRKLIDGEGNITHWIRDLQGRVTSKKFADDTTVDYSYHPYSGRLKTSTDALNQVATRSYFVDGNIAEIDYSEANTPDESFTYEPYYNRMATMVDGIGTTGFTYHPNDGVTDGAGMVARINGAFPDDTRKFTYDALGRLKKREIVDDATFTTATYSEEFVFDARSRVEDVINNLGTFNVFYVGQSNRIDYIDLPNGMTTDYTYENATGDHLIQQIKHLNSAGTPGVISQFDYTYRQDRNIETWTTQQNGAVAKKWTALQDNQWVKTCFRIFGSGSRDLRGAHCRPPRPRLGVTDEIKQACGRRKVGVAPGSSSGLRLFRLKNTSRNTPDATEDIAEQVPSSQAICLRIGPIRDGRRPFLFGRRHRAEGQRPSGLFVLRGARSRLRPGEGAEAVPVRSDPRLAGLFPLPDAPGAVPALRGEGRTRALGRGEESADQGLPAVPGPVGAAAELEGDRGGVQDQLGLRLHGRAGGGRLRPAQPQPGRRRSDRGGRDPVAQRPRLRHPGLSDRRRIEKAAACRPAPHHGVPFGFFRHAGPGGFFVDPIRLLGHVETLPSSHRRKGPAGPARAGPLPHRGQPAEGGQRDPGRGGTENEGRGLRRRAQTHQVLFPEESGKPHRQPAPQAQGRPPIRPQKRPRLPAQRSFPAVLELPQSSLGRVVFEKVVRPRRAFETPADHEVRRDDPQTPAFDHELLQGEKAAVLRRRGRSEPQSKSRHQKSIRL